MASPCKDTSIATDQASDTEPNLFTIPLGLRNRIYDLAFATGYDGYTAIYLTAAPPSKNILLTCRQAYQEGNGLYKHAYRRFWTNSNFKVPRGLAEYYRSKLENIRDQDIARIQHLTIEYVRSGRPNLRRANLHDGKWQYLGRNYIVVARDQNVIVAKLSVFFLSVHPGLRMVHIPDNSSEEDEKNDFESAGRDSLVLTKWELSFWLDFVVTYQARERR